MLGIPVRFRKELEEQNALEKELRSIEEITALSLGISPPLYEEKPSVIVIPRWHGNYEETMNNNWTKLKDRAKQANEEAERALELNKKNYAWLSGDHAAHRDKK